jgi:hypothetical protein
MIDSDRHPVDSTPIDNITEWENAEKNTNKNTD